MNSFVPIVLKCHTVKEIHSNFNCFIVVYYCALLQLVSVLYIDLLSSHSSWKCCIPLLTFFLQIIMLTGEPTHSASKVLHTPVISIIICKGKYLLHNYVQPVTQRYDSRTVRKSTSVIIIEIYRQFLLQKEAYAKSTPSLSAKDTWRHW